MKPTAKLHESGQSLWLDNISREMLDSGQFQRYIAGTASTRLAPMSVWPSSPAPPVAPR
jgi:transaldolase